WMADWVAAAPVFFFSSRRRHTRLQGDWSSDVCSSDLYFLEDISQPLSAITMSLILCVCIEGIDQRQKTQNHGLIIFIFPLMIWRSEERRVGKECRSRWWGYY